MNKRMRLDNKKLDKFQKWLHSCGAEMLPTTNQWELFRFKSNKGTGVVYRNSSGGNSINDEFVLDLYKYFLNGNHAELTVKQKRKQLTGKKAQLVNRDGRECFYCGLLMTDQEMSVEHILSVLHGGSNRIENLVLAHKRCNEIAGDLSIIEKIRLREKMMIGLNLGMTA